MYCFSLHAMFVVHLFHASPSCRGAAESRSPWLYSRLRDNFEGAGTLCPAAVRRMIFLLTLLERVVEGSIRYAITAWSAGQKKNTLTTVSRTDSVTSLRQSMGVNQRKLTQVLRLRRWSSSCNWTEHPHKDLVHLCKP